MERINFVVNMDLPPDTATFLHRIGRAGRYGTYGLAVTLAAPDEQDRLRAMDHELGTCMTWVAGANPVPPDRRGGAWRARPTNR